MSGDNSQKRTPSKLKGFDAFDLRLGDVMRGERATLGKSLIDIQRELKIKANYIAAIENADPTAFDTPGFIAGYVRSYARYLQMDPDWAWSCFCREAGFEQPHGLSAAASSPKPERPTGLDALGDPNATFVPIQESPFADVEMRAIGSLAVLVALIGAVGYGAWSVLQEVQRVQLAPVDNAPGVVADLGAGVSAPAAPSLPTQTSSVTSTDMRDRLYRERELELPVITHRDGPIVNINSDEVGVISGAASPASGQTVAALPAGATAASDNTPADPQVLADGVPGLHLIAVRPTWVRVSSADGTVLFEKTLEPGENWQVPPTEEPPVLRSGNSGALYFMVEGETYGPAGGNGEVIRNVPLQSAAVTERYALADAQDDPDLAVAVAVLQAAQ